jgi:outer membrane protein, heavy metal efflux system
MSILESFRTIAMAIVLITIPCSAQETIAEVIPQYDLKALRALAAEHNPTLKQAFQLIRGVEGKALQAGLWPNPTIAYAGEQIGLDGTAGEFQGGLIRQRIVTGGKLRLSREKYEARADVARHNLTSQEYRVFNNVNTAYYELLAADARLALHEDLYNIAKDRYKTVFELTNIGKKNHAELKLAGADLQKVRLDLFMTQNERKKAKVELESVIGTPLGETFVLLGELDDDIPEVLPEWEAMLASTLENSPQVLAALHKLRADEITVEREKREPIPDLVLEAGVGRNIVDDQTVYMAGVSLEIPLFDRNQGTIQQAEADLERQRAEVDRIRLELTRRFAQEYSHFLTRYKSVLDFQTTVLPKSESAYQMQLEMYDRSRIDWMDVLNIQTEYLLNRIQMVDHLLHFHRRRIVLEGFLLENGLQVPDSPTPPGHIDAVPKPR